MVYIDSDDFPKYFFVAIILVILIVAVFFIHDNFFRLRSAGEECITDDQCISGSCTKETELQENGKCGCSNKEGKCAKISDCCEGLACIHGSCSAMGEGDRCYNNEDFDCINCPECVCVVGTCAKPQLEGGMCAENDDCVENLVCQIEQGETQGACVKENPLCLFLKGGLGWQISIFLAAMLALGVFLIFNRFGGRGHLPQKVILTIFTSAAVIIFVVIYCRI